MPDNSSDEEAKAAFIATWKADTDADTDTDSDNDADADSDSDADTDADTDSDTECKSGPCCNTETQKYLPATHLCGQEPVETVFRCANGPDGDKCGAQVQKNERLQYCTGSSSECGELNLLPTQRAGAKPVPLVVQRIRDVTRNATHVSPVAIITARL